MGLDMEKLLAWLGVTVVAVATLAVCYLATPPYVPLKLIIGGQTVFVAVEKASFTEFTAKHPAVKRWWL